MDVIVQSRLLPGHQERACAQHPHWRCDVLVGTAPCVFIWVRRSLPPRKPTPRGAVVPRSNAVLAVNSTNRGYNILGHDWWQHRQEISEGGDSSDDVHAHGYWSMYKDGSGQLRDSLGLDGLAAVCQVGKRYFLLSADEETNATTAARGCRVPPTPAPLRPAPYRCSTCCCFFFSVLVFF